MATIVQQGDDGTKLAGVPSGTGATLNWASNPTVGHGVIVCINGGDTTGDIDGSGNEKPAFAAVAALGL